MTDTSSRASEFADHTDRTDRADALEYEVTINQNPTNTPNPLGPQAPDAPTGDIKGSEHRPRAGARPSRPHSTAPTTRRQRPSRPRQRRQRPADAKKGHNQPPEETPTEKFDLKKRPSDVPRGERGQFAPRTAGDEVKAEASGRYSRKR